MLRDDRRCFEQKNYMSGLSADFFKFADVNSKENTKNECMLIALCNIKIS